MKLLKDCCTLALTQSITLSLSLALHLYLYLSFSLTLSLSSLSLSFYPKIFAHFCLFAVRNWTRCRVRIRVRVGVRVRVRVRVRVHCGPSLHMSLSHFYCVVFHHSNDLRFTQLFFMHHFSLPFIRQPSC